VSIPAPTVDDRYYEVAKPNSLSERVMIAARDKMYNTFAALHDINGEDTILDVGVSDVITNGDNMIERKHPFPAVITAAGLGDGAGFRKAFPEISYVQVQPGAPLPFNDRHFKIAVSNAVLEHVGSYQAQQAFVEELLRVADKVFLTVPNRYFFVEHHTLLPLLHWTKWSFRAACKLTGKDKWARDANLILMSAGRLREIARRLPGTAISKIGYTGLNAGPFSSNLYMSISRR